jgi:transposase
MLIGVDVSKDTLVACQLDGKPFRLANAPPQITEWLDTLPADTRVAMEATGRYHRSLAELAVARGLTVYVLNPFDVHHYAKSLAPRATTDHIMADVIAQYAASARKLAAYRPAPAFVDELKSVMRARSGLMRQRVRLAHQCREAPALTRLLSPLLDDLQRAMTDLTHRLTELARAQAGYAALVGIPGIGELTAAYLLALLATHRFRTSDAFVAFLGLDLRVKDSGKGQKKRTLSKRGDPEARRLLYLAAIAAERHQPVFATLRQRALTAGRTKTEAAVIVARKLTRIVWSLYTHGTTYTAERVLTQG